MISTNYVICIFLVMVFIFIVAGCKITCNMREVPITDNYTLQDNDWTQKQSLGRGCKPPCYIQDVVIRVACLWKDPEGKIVNCPF